VATALAFSPNLEAAPKKQKQGKKHGPPPAAAVNKRPQAAVQRPHPQANAPRGNYAAANAARYRQRTPVVRAQPFRQRGNANANVNRNYQQQGAVAYQRNAQRAYNRNTSNRVDVNRTTVRNYQSNTQNYNYRAYQPPTYVYRDWDRGRVHHWNNHRYHWYNNAWVIVDAPVIEYSSGPTYYNSGSVEASVQEALTREGYHPGPIDGVLGGQTRDAIADYQRDHGQRPSGEVTDALLRSLDLK